MCRKHFTVSIYVHATVFGLFQQFFQIMQVMSAYQTNTKEYLFLYLRVLSDCHTGKYFAWFEQIVRTPISPKLRHESVHQPIKILL